ncbi:AGL226Cp [Eremothecium gossypii ATCC 10895]|uniref:Mediator of RNA polymerase II transcription subunit 12 n=1 Tax=Eremothecium gossypii (strain ATCC 10895 / CBS 109.51 / FGSC 9923 / NRRL Y-1056) TaxID=284811 RepID=SRB8_EREGS|nr:AGL226Cp [Eremothecium gossypii ATCC 10895]Q751D2.2 RecName: Full=Mediator of RNA polymerase II transcription subunit 12; AltName: Full=Mediator complex subunit 12 [Eremothecium gossypii ATCC 10895]AAS54265.2 AGL226Cp [Eremothecium gossypii ATCC 10895]
MSSSRYILIPPEDLHPLTSNTGNEQNIYPDFDPWAHTEIEDKILLSFVAKGHYTSAKVNFESISARSSLQESLPKVAGMLAEQFSKVVHLREQTINKVSGESEESIRGKAKFTDLAGPGFSLPNRVTLTDQRRTQWLQELSSPNVSLSKLAKSIPHGFKRKQILEQCYMRQLPLQRAIWLIKSSYSIEWKSLTSKLKPGQTNEGVVSQLYNLWTNSMVSIMERLLFEMPKYYNDTAQAKIWKPRVSYYINLLGNCYNMGLMDRGVFNHWLVEFVEKVENFEFLPLSLHLLNIFWSGICPPTHGIEAPDNSFLISKITVVLLHKHHMILQNKSMINDENYIINDLQRNARLKESLLLRLKAFILDIFHHQSLEAFIMPNQNWDLYKNCLYEIVTMDKTSNEQAMVIKRKLELITYRNDSLQFNLLKQYKMKSSSLYESDGVEIDNLCDMQSILNVPFLDPEMTKILDNATPGYDWTLFVQQRFTCIEKVAQMIMWATNPSRKARYDGAHLVAKLLLLKTTSQENLPDYNMEDMIWKLVFHFSKLSERELSNIVELPSLYELLNIFIGYGIIKVPTYIRKLISSGIMYISDSKDKFFHCELLINLKISPLMKNQYNMMLKNIMEYDATYYVRYNYEQLQIQLNTAKEQMLQEQFEHISCLPISVKIWVSEWYLSYVCSPVDNVLKPVDKGTVIKNFTIFGLYLKEIFHFYKWVEFIVYHQLLADINALSALIDVLLYYENLFPLLINDQILFMKTLIHIYSKGLKNKDNLSYNITEFNPFWKFFMKHFPYLVEIDSDLQLQLGEVYESEKIRIEKLTKSSVDVITLYCNINQVNEESFKFGTHNFPGIFQQNLKILLKTESADACERARKGLSLLMLANLGDYTKFMSIFLKRKDYTIEQLVKLISVKLLTLDQIQKIIGDDILREILSRNNYGEGLWYELHKRNFIKKNFKIVLSMYRNSTSLDDRKLFLDLLVFYGPNSRLQEQVTTIICNCLRESNEDYSLILSLLRYGTKNIDQGTQETINIAKLYENLNFTNLWIFQAFTNYYTEALFNGATSDGQTITNFVFELIDLTRYNVLCSHLFDRVANFDVLEKLLEVFEADFFKKCLSEDPDDVHFLAVMIETIMNLSRKMNQSSAVISMNNESFRLLQATMLKFTSMNKTALCNSEMKLSIYLKIFIVHQKFIFQKVCDSLRQDRYDAEADLVKSLRLLFENTGFKLKLRLLLYDILSSLKSFVIYECTKKSESKRETRKLQISEALQNLPPFHISSFLDDMSISAHGDFDFLGLTEQPTPAEPEEGSQFFLYNKRTREYECGLNIEPFQLLPNHQSREPGSSCHFFNDTALSLSLFDARFDKKNPT